MPRFRANVHVTHDETWEVEAEDAEQARQFIDDLTEAVDVDDNGGEVVDWQVVGRLKLVSD